MSEELQKSWTIERMTPDDVEPANKMWQQSWRDTYPNEAAGVSPEWVEQNIAAATTPEKMEQKRERTANSRFYVARDASGEVIGLTTPRVDEDGVQHVGSLYVDKQYHGSGVADQLMQKNIDAHNPAKPIELGVAVYNERAKAFYRRWRFEETGETTKFKDIIPEARMKRKPHGELNDE